MDRSYWNKIVWICQLNLFLLITQNCEVLSAQRGIEPCTGRHWSLQGSEKQKQDKIIVIYWRTNDSCCAGPGAHQLAITKEKKAQTPLTKHQIILRHWYNVSMKRPNVVVVCVMSNAGPTEGTPFGRVLVRSCLGHWWRRLCAFCWKIRFFMFLFFPELLHCFLKSQRKLHG